VGDLFLGKTGNKKAEYVPGSRKRNQVGAVAERKISGAA
jgi:hypothetical protein